MDGLVRRLAAAAAGAVLASTLIAAPAAALPSYPSAPPPGCGSPQSLMNAGIGGSSIRIFEGSWDLYASPWNVLGSIGGRFHLGFAEMDESSGQGGLVASVWVTRNQRWQVYHAGRTYWTDRARWTFAQDTHTIELPLDAQRTMQLQLRRADVECLGDRAIRIKGKILDGSTPGFQEGEWTASSIAVPM